MNGLGALMLSMVQDDHLLFHGDIDIYCVFLTLSKIHSKQLSVEVSSSFVLYNYYFVHYQATRFSFKSPTAISSVLIYMHTN